MLRPSRLFLLLSSGLACCLSELVINVSRGGPDANVFKQSVRGNVSADTVTITYVAPDGVGVRQVTDIKNAVTVTVVTIPGEEELGQPAYQVVCLVSAYAGDMIPSEAMTKLKQKHPGTVRVAEEVRGSVVQDSPVQVVVGRAGQLSPHIGALCREARDTTFSSEHELAKILTEQGREGEGGVGKGVTRRPREEYEELRRCHLVAAAATDGGAREACVCALNVCVHWYPCALKYCRNQSGEGEHRCGIRTCSKCTTFKYVVKHKNLCSWDEL